MNAYQDDDLDELRDALRGSVEEVCLALLGKPDQRTGGEWRWGNKGALSVAVRGPKRGLWNDHSGGITKGNGDMLGLIRRERGGSFPDVVRWARGFVGMAEPAEWEPHQPRERAKRDRQQEDREQVAEEAKRVTVAQRIAREAVAIEPGTIADRYLTDTRKIQRTALGWGAALGFHVGMKALVMRATNEAGEVTAVQLIYLTDDAQKISAEEAETRKLPGAKQTRGVLTGTAVRLAGESSALLLAEGPETGITAWTATGRETWIALGSMAKIEPPPLRRLLVVADDDPRDAPAAKQLRKAVVKWRGEGREVAVATPWPRRRFDKSDLNDLMQREGLVAVRARIAAALNPQRPQPGARLPVPLARHQLEKAINGFFQEARDFDPDKEEGPPPIVHGIKAGVGIGKSDLTRRVGAAPMLAEMRLKGDRHNGAMLVPTHKLGEEQARAFEATPAARAANLKAAVWRGREADDPGQPGQKMCQDLDAVRDARAAGISRVDAAVCHDPDADVRCPFFDLCGYQGQKKQKADLWIGAHELLFSEKPAAFGKLAFVVVDEAAWRKGLEGVDGPPTDLTLDALDPEVTIPGDVKGDETAVLRRAHGILWGAANRFPLGPIQRADMAAVMQPDTATSARINSWRRMAKVDIHPGMTPQLRRAAMAEAPNNRIAMRIARTFAALEALLAEDGPEASGWLSLERDDTDDGPVRVLRLRGRRKVAKGWQVPTLILDALLNPDLVRPYWPQVEVTAEIEATTPHMRVRQQIGRDWAKSALVPDDYNPDDRDRRLKNSERLRASVWREARQAGGRVLVVAQKAVEDHWRTCGVSLLGLELAHHNAVAGRDEWGPGPGREGVRLLVVVGRTLPRIDAAERMAAALTGAAVTTRASRWDRVDTAIILADGTAATTEADRHPDPLTEAVRWQICEGEIIQIIGRGRGVNRTAENPLEVLILTDRPLPLPVDEAVSWEALAPSPTDLMLAQAGVALESPTEASPCFPDLWPTPEAAKKTSQRGKWGTFPYRESSKGECPSLRLATYRRAGQGKRDAFFLFDPSVVSVDELRGWLEDRLGALAVLEVEEAPPVPEPPAPSPGKQAPRASRAAPATSDAPSAPKSRPAGFKPSLPADPFLPDPGGGDHLLEGWGVPGSVRSPAFESGGPKAR